MSLFITSLNSGSNGNCYYVGNDNEAVLVDVGISCREVEKRMKRLGLDMNKVKAIFISHEHGDHVRGLQVLLKKYLLPLYISTATYSHCGFSIPPELIVHFSTGQTIQIGNLEILPFSKQHDAVDPFSFVVSCNGVKVGVITDIGTACANVIKHFKECHAAFLESNYDEAMLQNGSYPYHLKNRIRGGKGHISNREALELFMEHKPAFMSHLLLSHLSHNNNCPKLVNELFAKHAGNVKVVVASRYEETRVFQIQAKEGNAIAKPVAKPLQLTLAF